MQTATDNASHTILVVEEDDATRTFLADQFTADGYTVYATADLKRALGLCISQLPDAALVDVNSGSGRIFATTVRGGAERRLDPRLPLILLGTIPGAGGTQRLTRLVGIQKAKEIVYSGAFYSAEESLAMGLVDKVFPTEEVYERAVEAAAHYAQGPFALRMAKKAIDEGYEMDLDSALRLETTLFAATFATDDRRIGMDSFVEQGPGKATFTRN